MSVETSEPDRDRRTCSPCRGTGRVISNLGGERQELACPWCEGSGEFKPEHDAQEQAPPAPKGGEEPPVGAGEAAPPAAGAEPSAAE